MSDIAERFPCGCIMKVEDEVFVFQPHSESCEVYAEVVTEMRKADKPISTVDLTVTGQLDFKPECPECGALLDGYTASDAVPSPGDISLCAYCAAVNIFTETGIRKPTPLEALELKGDQRVQLMVKNVKRTIAKRKES